MVCTSVMASNSAVAVNSVHVSNKRLGWAISIVVLDCGFWILEISIVDCGVWQSQMWITKKPIKAITTMVLFCRSKVVAINVEKPFHGGAKEELGQIDIFCNHCITVLL